MLHAVNWWPEDGEHRVNKPPPASTWLRRVGTSRYYGWFWFAVAASLAVVTAVVLATYG